MPATRADRIHVRSSALLMVVALLSSLAGCRHASPEDDAASPPRFEIASPSPSSAPTPSTNGGEREAASPDVVESPEPTPVVLEGDIRADLALGIVSFPGTIALDEGWLEVAVCTQGTREHEAVVVTAVKPSLVHAALLMVGAEAGRPGGYHENGMAYGADGEGVAVTLEFAPAVGEPLELAEAILDAREPETRATLGWVFAGSMVRPNPASLGPGEYYAADYGGSIIGLSTFGDEVVAAIETRSPDSGVEEAVWRIREHVLPPEGTPVRVVLRRVASPSSSRP